MASPRHRRLTLVPRHAVSRIAASVVGGVTGYALLAPHTSTAVAMLTGWNLAGLILAGISWANISRADAPQTRERASSEDPGRTLVYAIVLITSATSLLAAATLVGSSVVPDRHALMIQCVVTVCVAWVLTHTAFTFRYAHLYYRDDSEGVGGVTVPGSGAPTYLDFAYFAFTIGMCFQVSDCCVTSRQIRRAVLFHALISFAYNTLILAFVLNAVFSART